MMSEILSSDQNADTEKPAAANEYHEFPPYPDPEDKDFEEDIKEEERNHYLKKYHDLNIIINERLHCTACDRHLGCSVKNEIRMRSHPMLRTLVCYSCHTFYNSGEFEKGDDGSELYCRWCGQGGQVYCCADCQHVFCAKCIKRNLGVSKIKEIESLDDWKCFKCNPKCLWDLRALCWALLRFIDIRNKITYNTEDTDLKEKYHKMVATDLSSCCTDKRRRSLTGVKRKHDFKKEKKEDIKKEKKEDTKKEKKDDIKKEKKDDSNKDLTTCTSALISKMPPTIQVKKFASINLEDRNESKGRKRSFSPKSKTPIMKNPIAIAPFIKQINVYQPQAKKIRYQPPFPIQSNLERPQKMISYSPRIMRPKLPILSQPTYNGYNPLVINSGDNINLSLESLTQGLDMAAVTSMDNDDVVCTPDFPLETCEDFDDENDDDVQCITPAPVVAPKSNNYTINKINKVPDLSPDNIVQMTDNDVTVNAVTGGLKFRVDPQTLSSNKMYRLPDGRIFAINPNPAMPGGYSATIVAISDNLTLKSTSKGPTYSAKVCPVPSKNTVTPPPLAKISRVNSNPSRQVAARKTTNTSKAPESETRKVDVEVPVEWYRYNLIDAVDSLEYSLKRLRKLKKEATTVFLRSRSVDEMRALHRTLDRVLQISTARFSECRTNLNQGLKQYVINKSGENQVSDDDDDVEILHEQNDDPIFIDENSLDSVEATKNDSQGIDLIDTSDANDSIEKETNDISEAPAGSTNGSFDNNATNKDACGSKCLSDIVCPEDFNKEEGNDKTSDPLNNNECEMPVDQEVSKEAVIFDEDKTNDEDKIKETINDKDEATENCIDNDDDHIEEVDNTDLNNDDDKKVKKIDDTNSTDKIKSGNIDESDDTKIYNKNKEVSVSNDTEEKDKEELDENTLLQDNTDCEVQNSEYTKQDADMNNKLIESLLCDEKDAEAQKKSSIKSDAVA